MDNVEVGSADITLSSATPAVVAIPSCIVGQIVQIYTHRLIIGWRKTIHHITNANIIDL